MPCAWKRKKDLVGWIDSSNVDNVWALQADDTNTLLYDACVIIITVIDQWPADTCITVIRAEKVRFWRAWNAVHVPFPVTSNRGFGHGPTDRPKMPRSYREGRILVPSAGICAGGVCTVDDSWWWFTYILYVSSHFLATSLNTAALYIRLTMIYLYCKCIIKLHFGWLLPSWYRLGITSPEAPRGRHPGFFFIRSKIKINNYTF